MRQFFLVAAALIAGFVGGFAGFRVGLFCERSQPAQVLRAHSFELVDEAGQTSSYWGPDNGQQVVLAFGKMRSAASPGSRDAVAKPGNDLRDPNAQRTSIGLLGDSTPFIKFRGEDGKTRVRLYLSMYEKPFFLLEDETGPRISLGLEQSDTPSAEDDNWTLRFDPDRVSMGMITEKRGGEKYVRGFLSVHPDPVKNP
jgi:hypothetical protein